MSGVPYITITNDSHTVDFIISAEIEPIGHRIKCMHRLLSIISHDTITLFNLARFPDRDGKFTRSTFPDFSRASNALLCTVGYFVY